jgi:hypothetical protein
LLGDVPDLTSPDGVDDKGGRPALHLHDEEVRGGIPEGEIADQVESAPAELS